MTDTKGENHKYAAIEIVGAIIGLSGFLTAFCWFLGRLFYIEYYQAIGVSRNLVDISNEDYTSLGAPILAPSLLIAVFVIFFYVILSSSNEPISEAIEYIEKHLFHRLSPKRRTTYSYYSFLLLLGILWALSAFPVEELAKELTGLKSPPLRVFTFMMIAVLILRLILWQMRQASSDSLINMDVTEKASVLLLILLIVLLLVPLIAYASNSGYAAGCKYILTMPRMLTIYSKNPLPLDNLNNTSAQNGWFEYSGYYGFIGRDYFVLYKTLDAKTNHPEKLYYLRKSEVFSFNTINLEHSDSKLLEIEAKCQSMADLRTQNAYFKQQK